MRSRTSLLEAVLLVTAARLALAVLPFARTAAWLSRPMRGPELEGEERARRRREVQRALHLVQRRHPGRSTCVHRALAAQVMLRRRGIGAMLYYGARTLPGQGLTAHAWVQDGPVGVIGMAVARKERHHTLARYPAA